MLTRLLFSVLAGLSWWLAFPSMNLWPLAILGSGAIVGALCGVSTARGVLLGLVAGLSCFVPLLSWSGIYVGALPWLSLATLSALYVAAFGGLAAYLQRSGDPARVRPLAVALAWVAAEWARATTPFGGFPWARLGFSQADSPVVGVARWLGVPGVGFVVVLVGALLALGVQAWLRDRRPLRAGGALLLAVTLLLGPMLVPRPVDGTPVQVLGIQGNVPELTLEFNAQRRQVLDNHVETTLAAAEQVAAGELPQPDLVLWPENASDIDPLRNADAADVITAAVTAIDAPVVVGGLLEEPGANVSNVSLLYLPGEGPPVDRYTKRRPVPFAEYIPYRGFFRAITTKVDLVPRDFVAGDGVGLLEVPTADGVLPLGIGICFEVVIDDVMRDSVRAGAEVMAIPTNNATFGLTDESVQQLAASRVMAITLGRPIVHASTVGVSALVAPDGSASEQTELFTRDIISGSVPRRTELTPAVRLGAWPQSAAVGMLALALVWTVRTRRRERGTV
ncbi:MAG: apolipoprotein N-acyltransferase [Ornithinimicrobium sp.]|uniref:apolipoprotein N-acyltransferase n=1 Tax=Ornithinimicrobium sp. TaxID=1977084 RepID=UPI003D9BA044